MDFCQNQNSPKIVNMSCFNNMKENYRNHSHLLAGQGTAYCAAPACANVSDPCLVIPALPVELPRPLRWPVGGPGGDRRAEGRSQAISPPVVLPWAASDRDNALSAVPP